MAENKKRIMVIEDDTDIRELIEYNLTKSGFEVFQGGDGESAMTLALRTNPDLIVLDIMLPGMSGLKVCQMLRDEPKTAKVPIIILSAKGEESDIVTGLELGADDYVTKPFSPKELTARVKAVLKRATPKTTDNGMIHAGPITLDSDRHIANLNNQPLVLTLTEFKLLRTLAKHPGRVFTRDQILEKVAGADTFLVDRNVDVHIRALRKKLGEDADYISTIRGVGYKFKEINS